MTGPDRTPPEPGPEAGIDDIEADIERTREELGETVGALSAKLDVKGRAKQQAVETRERLAAKSKETKDLVRDKPAVPAIAALALMTIGVVVWRRRRR